MAYAGREEQEAPNAGEDAGRPGHEGDESTQGDWCGFLTPEQRRIMLEKGTEAPFTGEHWDNKRDGVYHCAACGQALFLSGTKFESGTGWPSFFRPASPEAVREERDMSHGMMRSEITCSRCGGHLGHVFEDGPQPTGLRYCVNSASLRFEPAKPEGGSMKRSAGEPRETVKDARSQGDLGTVTEPQPRTAMFGAGCFWAVEAAFRRVKGVLDTAVGYSGGTKESPTYREVCTDRTGHAEVVLVSYDPAVVSYEELLDVFWRIHDPTQANRQGPDVGRQYRSVVFYHGDDQREAAERSKAKLAASGAYRRPIATAIEPAREFWRAEEYHQRYNEKHGHSVCPVR